MSDAATPEPMPILRDGIQQIITSTAPSGTDYGDGQVHRLASGLLPILDALNARIAELTRERDEAKHDAERRQQFITECQQLLGTHDSVQVAIERLIQRVEKADATLATVTHNNVWLNQQYVALEKEREQARRWEVGFRNIVTILVGPRTGFEIPEIVEQVRSLTQQRDSARKIAKEAVEYLAEFSNMDDDFAQREGFTSELRIARAFLARPDVKEIGGIQ